MDLCLKGTVFFPCDHLLAPGLIQRVFLPLHMDGRP